MFGRKLSMLLVFVLIASSVFWGETTEKAEGRETIIISDMSKCQPACALSKEKKKNCWTLFSYESDEVNGVMIGAGSRANAQDVTLPLGVSGWYAIYLGFWNPHHDYDGGTTIKLKLTGDPCFRPISDGTYSGGSAAPMMWDKAELQECFVRYADLTDKDMIIGQQSKGLVPQKAYVAYIKLVPLSEEKVDSIKKDRARKDTRILIATNDGIGLFSKGYTTKEELLEMVEPYRYCDVGQVQWAFTYGDMTNYPSNVGNLWSSGMSSKAFTGAANNEIWCKTLESLISKGIIPVQVVLEHVHSMGLEFHAMIRMAILGDIAPSDYPSSIFLASRPDLRMLAKDGTALEKASYAFEEVQEHMLSLIREIVESFDVDGISLCFIRGPQFVGYESPVIEDFKKKYGEDPRKLDDNDIRVQQLRADYMTQFVRKVRGMLNEVGSEKGKKLDLTAWGFPLETTLFYGIDVKTLVEEELLDGITGMGWESKEFVKTLKEHNCKFYHNKGAVPAEDILRSYENGVDGFTSWDTNFESPELWAMMSRIGHKEEIETFVKNPPKIKRIKLKTVGGKDICHPTNIGANEKGYWPPEMLSVYSGG